MATITIKDGKASHAEDLTDAEAWALAQFCKRVGWREMRECAIDDAETYEIRAAIDKLQKCLINTGNNPR